MSKIKYIGQDHSEDEPKKNTRHRKSRINIFDRARATLDEIERAEEWAEEYERRYDAEKVFLVEPKSTDEIVELLESGTTFEELLQEQRRADVLEENRLPVWLQGISKKKRDRFYSQKTAEKLRASRARLLCKRVPDLKCPVCGEVKLGASRWVSIDAPLLKILGRKTQTQLFSSETIKALRATRFICRACFNKYKLYER